MTVEVVLGGGGLSGWRQNLIQPKQTLAHPFPLSSVVSMIA